MVYSFNYSSNKVIYVQTGFDSYDEAEKELKNIAEIFNKEGITATGRVNKRVNDELFVLKNFLFDD